MQEAKAKEKAQEETEKLTKETNTSIKEAETFVATQTKEVEPKVEPDKGLQAVKAVEEVKAAKKAERIEAIQAAQAIKKAEKTESTSEVSKVDSEVKETGRSRKSIWARRFRNDDDSSKNIWSRGSGRSNNIWNRNKVSTDSLNNIWAGFQSEIKPTVENSTESTKTSSRFDFSKFKQVLDFFA